MRLLPVLSLLPLALLLPVALPAHADDAAARPSGGPRIEVDGRIDPDEWAGARHITDFRLTQPLSLEASPYPTEAWVKSTPDGLAVAFRNVQPAGVPRTAWQSTQPEARNAASVFPEPVGAAISVWRPWRMASQPRCWAGVGS